MSLVHKWSSFHMFYTPKCLQGFSKPQTVNRFEIDYVFEELDCFERKRITVGHWNMQTQTSGFTAKRYQYVLGGHYGTYKL